jgi:hypothetical protein
VRKCGNVKQQQNKRGNRQISTNEKWQRKKKKDDFDFLDSWNGVMLGAGKQLHVVATFIIAALVVVGGEKSAKNGGKINFKINKNLHNSKMNF